MFILYLLAMFPVGAGAVTYCGGAGYHRLPNGVRTNVFVAEVPHYTMIMT